MLFTKITDVAQKHFPRLRIRYKDQSWLMRLLGTLLFFIPAFNRKSVGMLGNTVYFPTANSVRLHPVSSSIILLHELVHLYDKQQWSPFVFGFLYLCPQILALITAPLIFLISWKIFLFPTLLLLTPLPSFFRVRFEKRAYLASLYCLQSLGLRLHFNPSLRSQENLFIEEFDSWDYYFMGSSNLRSEFDEALFVIQQGGKPFQDHIFEVLDDIIEQST